MRITNPLGDLSRFELLLWLASVLAISGAFLLAGGGDMLTPAVSLVGVTALIFVAKGYVVGQALTLVFALFYGAISYFFGYYGEMIICLCMTVPLAVFTIVSWLRHPFAGSREVAVQRLSAAQARLIAGGALLTATVFYFILGALDTVNLLFSTVSVGTSFVASCLMLCRSPYYGAAYAANDLVLIVLWVLAVRRDIGYLPMVICFVMFLLNDVYGFYNWRRMQQRQSA